MIIYIWNMALLHVSIVSITKKEKKMKSRMIRILSVAGRYLVCFLLILGGCTGLGVFLTGCTLHLADVPGINPRGNEDDAVRRTDTAMGTVFSMNIDLGPESEAISLKILDLVRELESGELSWRLNTSQVYALNHGKHIEEDGELVEILKWCGQLSRDSAGAFDVTVGNLTSLWDIDRLASGEENAFVPGTSGSESILPDQNAILDALAHSGYDKMEWTGNRVLLREGIRLDLGAVGKGIALDRIYELLEEHKAIEKQEAAGAQALPAGGAVISAGGSIMTYGSKPGGTPWTVAIVDPKNPSGFIGYLSLEGTRFVSTSGDYERYIEVDGRRYCHIIDPTTGYPVDNGISGVTVVADSGLKSDGLSTALFVLGPGKGLELAGRYGVEALFVDSEGKITMTEGMEKLFTPGT